MNEQDRVLVVAEIGQNHNGSVDLAKLLVDLVARPIHEDLFDMELRSIDAVKLTKRDMSQELSVSEMNRRYDSPDSFGHTYGDHRAALELSPDEHAAVYDHARQHRLLFVETVCNPGALEILDRFRPDYIKVASRDLTNLPLLSAISKTNLPVILSTGMHGGLELDRAIEELQYPPERVSILHCVSEYPTNPLHTNLRSIQFLLEHYPDFRVGYSDHTVGIMAPVAAVAMGARIIEKHVTIDRGMKGTDQAGSLGPDGVKRMIRDIRLLEMMLGDADLSQAPGAEAARRKLERSIATRHDLHAGHVIRETDVWLLSPGHGFRWSQLDRVVGRRCRIAVPANEILEVEMLE